LSVERVRQHGYEEAVMATLQIELEDMAGASWWSGVLATLASQSGNACLRFVGRVDGDRRYKGATFPAPGMAKSLEDLRSEIESDGWVEVGRGDEPWTFTYGRSGSGA
jgi:hypothetical protein